MIIKEKIDRINALAKKSKEEGLNDIEKAEQKKLREEYLESFRANFKQQLEQIEFVDEVREEIEIDAGSGKIEIDVEITEEN